MVRVLRMLWMLRMLRGRRAFLLLLLAGGLIALTLTSRRAWAEPLPPPHNPVPPITLAEARVVLPRTPATCTDIPCLLEQAYAADPEAKELALALHRDTGSVAGVGPAETMDGGYRGKIKLVPQLPIGRYRKHLAWTTAAARDVDAFFTALFADHSPPAYRWTAITYRFIRSPGKRTPSAYAMGWLVAYNVNGSLMKSAPHVAETLFHELFHTNDFAHGDWSAAALTTDFDAIVAKCGTRVACLTPYAPNTTKVRGGTYYAFQPDNGATVHEYAAELAVRYWKEQRAMLANGALAAPAFKCGPAPNARVWKLLVDEFFAGKDLVPACP